MSSVYTPVVVPPDKNTEGRMDKGHSSGAAGNRRAAPAFKSPSGRVIYKPSPVAKLIAAMRQKKTLEEMEEIMAPEAAGLDRSNLTVPGLQNGSLRDENKENMTRNLDGEGRATPEVDKSDVQQDRSKEPVQKDPVQDPVDQASNAAPVAGSRVGEGKERPTAAGRKQKVMTWLDSHEEMLQQHDPADLILTPPSTERAADVRCSSRRVGDSMEEVRSSQEHAMDDGESDDDTVKMDETDGTIQGAAESRHQEQRGDRDSNMEENEEGTAGGMVEEETPEADQDDMSEPDMDGEEGQEVDQRINMPENDTDGEEGKEMEQPPHDRLSQSSQSIAWADNIDNVSVDTTATSEPEKAAATTLQKATAVKPFKEHILYNWFIKPVRKSTDIVVEGHRKQDPEHQFWHSTAIVKRVTSRMVVTGSGTVYRLRGVIDRAMVLEQGFDVKVARAFRTGFPENWKEVLEDKSNGTSEKQGGRQSNKQDTRISPKVHPKVGESLPSTTAVGEIQPPPLQTVLGSLQRSRSGRVVKPRMAWWANQRVVVEKDDVRIRCSSNDELAKSPAFLNVKTVTGKDLVVHKDDLQESRCGTPSTIKRRPASVVRPAVKTVVGDPQPADLRDPPDGSDQRDPPGTSDQRDPPGTSDQRDPPGMSDQRDPPGTSDQRDPPGMSDQRDPLGTSDQRDPPGTSDQRDPLGTSDQRDPPGTADQRDPPGRPDQLDPPGTSDQRDPVVMMHRLDPEGRNDTVVTTDILLDTPGAPKGREPLGTVRSTRQLRNARSKRPLGVPEDILNTPKPTDTFKNSESGEDDTAQSQLGSDQSTAHETRRSARQKKPKAQKPAVGESDVPRKRKTRQSRGEPCRDTSTEEEPSTGKQVPIQKGRRRGRSKKEGSIGDVQTAKDASNTSTRKKRRPGNKRESSAVKKGQSEDTEPEEKKEVPRRRKSVREEDENHAEEAEKRVTVNSRRGRGRKRTQSSASQDTVAPRRSPRIKDVAAGNTEDEKEEPTVQRRGGRRGRQNGKTSVASLNSNGRKEQAEHTPDNTELEKDSEDTAGKALESENKGRRHYPRKKKANNKKTEEGETSPTVQVDEDNNDKRESDQDTRTCRSQRKKERNKKSPANSKERQQREQSKDVSETSWTLEEEKKLHSAVSSISGEDEGQWQKVAEAVGSHTAQDCQARYQEMTSTSSQPARSKDKEDASRAKKEPKKPVVLSGKAGTLKRKRQIQELMKQYNEGHEDEAFEDGITPFKKQRKISKGRISIDYNADEDGDAYTDVSVRHAFQTPMSRLFGGHGSRAAEPTPKGFRTPGTISEEVQKSNLDRYVFKQQKGKKGRALNAGPQKTLGGGRQVGRKTKLPNIDFSKLLTAQPMEDSDSDGDDYFSDNQD